MDKKINEMAKECIEIYGRMNPRLQAAVLWVLENYDMVKTMCQGDLMPEEKWMTYINRASEQQDMFAVTLLECKKVYDEQKRQNKSAIPSGH